MSLLSHFRAHAGVEVREQLPADSAELEHALEKLAAQGYAAWPELKLGTEQFLAFVARHLPREAAQLQELSALRAGDLYLVCAYGLSLPGASQVLESQYMSKLRWRLAKMRTPESVSEDILQELRMRLAEMQRPEITRRGYSGRGELLAWLGLCSIRESRLRSKRRDRERPLEQTAAELLPTPDKDPELAQLISLYKGTFLQAFSESVAALSSRERNLLRYHFLSRLSIDRIGQLYGVHRATAARWVAHAQERLIEQARELFLLRIPMDSNSLSRVLHLLSSQLHLSLGQVLIPAAESE